MIKIKKIYSLRDSQVKCLYNTINLGLMLKSIKNSDIVYSNSEIQDIKGIILSQGQYKIDIDIYSGLDEEVGKVTGKKEEKFLRNL